MIPLVSGYVLSDGCGPRVVTALGSSRRSCEVSWPGCAAATPGRAVAGADTTARSAERRHGTRHGGIGHRHRRVGTKCAPIRCLCPPGWQAPQIQLGPQTRRPGRAGRAGARAGSGRPPAVRRGRPRPADGPEDRRAARRAVRPAGPSRAGTAAARLLDLGCPARPVPRHRPRRPHADRRRDRRHRAGRGYRAGRLVGAAPGPAAGRPGARRLPGQRGLAVPRLTGRPGQRAAPVRPGAVRLRAGDGHRRGLPGRPPGAAAGRGRQPRRSGQPPGRAGLARPVRARPAARPPPGPPPARLPVAARVPAGQRGERAVRPVLAPGRAATPGTNRR